MKLSKTSLQLALGTLLFASLVSSMGCSSGSDVNGRLSQSNGQSRALASVQTNACSGDALAEIERLSSQEGLDAIRLPDGLYLYSSTDVLLESRAKAETRLLAREIPTARNIQSHVVCGTREEGSQLDLSLKALTKFSIKNGQNSVTVRQYQAYMNERGLGMVALNPRLQAQPVRSLSEYVQQTKARIYKIDERTYAVLTEREQEDGRLQVLVKYEFVNRN